MNLIKWENQKIVITPEAYGIKAFRNIWNKDRSQSKDRAIMTLSALYFMYDPRSDFQYITDDDERMGAVVEEVGLTDWKPDSLFNAAIPTYIRLTHTTSSKLLKGNRLAANTIEQVLSTPLPTDMDVEDRIKLAEKLANTVMKSNILAVEIAKVEKTIHQDVEDQSSKAIGKTKLTLGDTILDIMDGYDGE